MQNTATAGAAAAIGGYLIQWWNTGAIALGFYAHRAIDVIPSNAFMFSQEATVAIAGALGGYVLHKLAKGEQENRLSPDERAQVRGILAQQLEPRLTVEPGATGTTGASSSTGLTGPVHSFPGKLA